MAQPLQLQAAKTLNWALRVGKAKRFSCFNCALKESEPHWDDPSKPLDVRWYCEPCWRKELKLKKLESEAKTHTRLAQMSHEEQKKKIADLLDNLALYPDIYEKLDSDLRETIPLYRIAGKDSLLHRQILAQSYERFLWAGEEPDNLAITADGPHPG